MTFVEYGNSSICDNATQIVELGEENAVEQILEEGFNAEALVREMSAQFGTGFDSVSLAGQLESEAQSRELARVVDEKGEKKVTHTDLLNALDTSLGGGAVADAPIEPVVAVPPSAAAKEDLRKREEQEKKKAREEEAKKLRDAELKAAALLAETEALMGTRPAPAAQAAKSPTLPPKPALPSKPSVESMVVPPPAAAAAAVVVVAAPAPVEAASSAGPSTLAEFLKEIGLAETQPVFDERKLTWNSLKLADADDLAEFGIPKKILQKVIDGLMRIPGTAVHKSGGARAQEIDYEHMATLPPLPADPPLMSNKVEYKNYMRLKYEHQKRERKIKQTRVFFF